MYRYHTMMAKSWEEMPLHLVGFYHRPREIVRELITPQVLSGGEECFAEARRRLATISDPARRRRLERNVENDTKNFGKWVALLRAIGPLEEVRVPVAPPPAEAVARLPHWPSTQADNQPFPATDFAFYCTADALHVRARCEEKEMHRFRDGHPCRDQGFSWGEENIEVLILTDNGEGKVMHVALNSVGGVMDARDGDESWDREWSCRVEKGKDQWVMDIALPFASLGRRPRPGDTWRVNCIRNVSHDTYIRCGFPCALNGRPMPNTFARLRFVP
jgi:hypothetical protein